MRQRLMALLLSGAILGSAVSPHVVDVLVESATELAPMETYGGKPNLIPYKDIGGVPTWCYGETLGIPKARYTVQECDVELLKSVHRHWRGLSQYVPQEAPQSVKVGMLLVAYNTGVAGWAWEGSPRRVSRFRVALDRGDWRGACEAITAPWQGTRGVAKGYKATVQGKPVRGLENRRAKEYAVCVQDL